MAFLPIRKIHRGPGSRPPGSLSSALDWIKQELWTLLIRSSSVVDWAVDYLGKVGVDTTDEPGVLEDKLVDSATIVWTKGGSEGARTMSAAATGAALEDHKVATDATDEGAGGAGYLLSKFANTGNVGFSLDTTAGRRVKATVLVPAPDDHLVKATNADATAPAGLIEKSLDSTSIARSSTLDGGILKIYHTLVPPVTLPLPDGVAAIGTDPRAALANHVHPKTTMPQVKCLCGEQVALGAWVEGPPGTWTTVMDAYIGSPSAWTDGETLLEGDIVFVADWVMWYYDGGWHLPGVVGGNTPYAGPYEIIDLGGADHPAVIRRATPYDEDSEFEVGMSALVESGNNFGGQTLTLLTPNVDVNVTNQAWAVGSGPASTTVVTWDRIVPTGMATYPMPSLTIAEGGRLTLEPGNFFLVDPAGRDLSMISVPTCPPDTTVPITLYFTSALSLVHNAPSDAGFASLYLHRTGSPNNPALAFKYPKSVANFILAVGEWVMTSYHSTM